MWNIPFTHVPNNLPLMCEPCIGPSSPSIWSTWLPLDPWSFHSSNTDLTPDFSAHSTIENHPLYSIESLHAAHPPASTPSRATLDFFSLHREFPCKSTNRSEFAQRSSAIGSDTTCWESDPSWVILRARIGLIRNGVSTKSIPHRLDPIYILNTYPLKR